MPSLRLDPPSALALPAPPAALKFIHDEQAKANPDPHRISEAIARDVELAAEVLRVINSPAFGMRRAVGSISSAISLLGLTNVTNVVSAAALRASLSALAGTGLERYWDTSMDVALVSARVAKEYTGVSPDAAYTLGLFHDSGIPLLLALHPDYGTMIKSAVNSGWKITDAEGRYFGANHAAIGFHVAREWNLPQEITQAILYHHHYPEVLTMGGIGEDVRTLISVLKLGEYVSAEFRAAAFRREATDWPRVGDRVLDHLAIGDLEFLDLSESLLEMLRRR
jgi:HD-like signal output (HDOD) protein